MSYSTPLPTQLDSTLPALHDKKLEVGISKRWAVAFNNSMPIQCAAPKNLCTDSALVSVPVNVRAFWRRMPSPSARPQTRGAKQARATVQHRHRANKTRRIICRGSRSGFFLLKGLKHNGTYENGKQIKPSVPGPVMFSASPAPAPTN